MLITGVNLEVEKEKDYKFEIELNRIITFESPAKRRKLEDVARPSTSPRAWRPSPTCRSRGTRRGRPSTPTIGMSSMWEVLGPAEAGQGTSSQARGTRCMPGPDSTSPPPTSLIRSSLGMQSQSSQTVSAKLCMSGAAEGSKEPSREHRCPCPLRQAGTPSPPPCSSRMCWRRSAKLGLPSGAAEGSREPSREHRCPCPLRQAGSPSPTPCSSRMVGEGVPSWVCRGQTKRWAV